MRTLLAAALAVLVVALPAQLRADTLACGTLDGLVEPTALAGTATGDIDMGAFDLELSEGQKLILDNAENSWLYSTSPNTVRLVTGNSARLTLTTVGATWAVDVDFDGSDLILDTDGDSKISAAVDDSIKFDVGGTTEMTLDQTYLTLSNGHIIRTTVGDFKIDASAGSGDLILEAGSSSRGIRIVGGTGEARFAAGTYPAIPDQTTPACLANHGCLWVESDGTLHFRHGTTGDETIGGSPDVKSYSLRTGTSGTRWIAGFYSAPAADVNFTDGSPTATHGSANGSAAAHAFIVAGGAGTCSGGCTTCTLVVSGTSIDDSGTRTPADSETISADVTAEALDAYSETVKKWLGQVTWTLTPDAGTCTLDANIGLAKYDDRGNREHTVVGFEVVGEAGANDAGFNATLFHHTSSGWSYNATAFAPGSTVLADQNTDHTPESELINGEPFAYKRTNLSTAVDGDGSEGYLVRIVTGAANSIDNLDAHVSVTF